MTALAGGLALKSAKMIIADEADQAFCVGLLSADLGEPLLRSELTELHQATGGRSNCVVGDDLPETHAPCPHGALRADHGPRRRPGRNQRPCSSVTM